MTKEELLKTARPIFFTNDMVRATLEGRKTVFRKLIKCTLPESDCIIYTRNSKSYVNIHGTYISERVEVPYSIGDILYVKETFMELFRVFYKASDLDEIAAMESRANVTHLNWLPSVSMPKKFARLFLRVKSIRLESLDEIDGEEAVKEGFFDKYYCDGWYSFEPVKQFIDYWDWEYIKDESDRAYYGYYASPWVWVVDFEVVEYD